MALARVTFTATTSTTVLPAPKVRGKYVYFWVLLTDLFLPDCLYTTSNGVPMPHPYETQRVGENGPLLLQDFHLVDLLSHFDRERIPEV